MKRRRKKTKRLSTNELRLQRVRKYRELIAGGATESQAIAASGYSPTDIRSRKFWREKYNKIRRWAKEQGMDPDERVGSIERFISLYTAFVADAGENPHIMRDIKYALRYKSGYKTVLAEAEFLRSLQKKQMEEYQVRLQEYEAAMESFDDSDVQAAKPVKPEKPEKRIMKLSELKELTTTEFAEMYSAELREMYYDLKRNGMTGKEAKEYISGEMFGSP